MRLLFDTNIFLEVLLGQENEELSKKVLNSPDHYIFISDFSLHSIGLILFQRNKPNVFSRFIDDAFERLDIHLVNLLETDLKALTDLADRFNLDFDDAYQYLVAEKND